MLSHQTILSALIGIFLLALTVPALAGNETTPGRVDVDPPTLIGLGFEWWIDGDDNNNATLTVEHRKQGQSDWKPALEPFYSQGKDVKPYGNKGAWAIPIPKHFAGSIINLEEDTAYEVKLTLSDPDGVQGEAEHIFQARTRKTPVAFPGGTTHEVSADGAKGETLQAILPKLQPGDTVLLHAGTYTPPAYQAPPSPKSASGEPVKPGNGRVLHVYPPGHKGPKEKPNFTTVMHAYHGARWMYDCQYMATTVGMMPGDTLLVHAGTYQTKPTSYRYILSLWQHGTYRFTRKGTAENPITIKAAGDGEVIFDGAGAYRMMDFLGSEYNVIDGITIENAFIGYDVADAVKELKAKGLVIQNCTIRDVRTAILGAEKTDVKLIDTTIEEGAFADRREGRYVVTTDGTAEKPITFKPAGDGEVILDGQNNTLLFDVMAADHIIFDGLTMRNTFTAINGGRRGAMMGSTGLTVKNCRFENIQNGVWGQDGHCRDFTVLDNVFLGRAEEDGRGGYAVVLNGAGHAVGYNYSYAFWDHLNVSTSALPLEGNRAWSMDFYNNICIRGIDNIFELDGTMWNTRFLRNLCSYSNSFAFSSQQTNIGPSYYIRNILFAPRKAAYKFLRSPGARAMHNSLCYVASKGHGDDINSIVLEKGAPHPFVNVPLVEGDSYPSRGTPPHDVTTMDFSLQEGSDAIDAGKVIPGLNEDFAGDAPDLGAIEHGKPAPHYGPRTQPINK
jgi:hypothetical protein